MRFHAVAESDVLLFNLLQEFFDSPLNWNEISIINLGSFPDRKKAAKALNLKAKDQNNMKQIQDKSLRSFILIHLKCCVESIRLNITINLELFHKI